MLELETHIQIAEQLNYINENHIEEHLNNLTPLSIHIPMPNSNEDGCVGYYLIVIMIFLYR